MSSEKNGVLEARESWASGFPLTGFLCQFASDGAGFFRGRLKIMQHLCDIAAHLAQKPALIVDQFQFFLR
jgi:hypothetical protein